MESILQSEETLFRIVSALAHTSLKIDVDEDLLRIWQNLDVPATREEISSCKVAQLAASLALGLGLSVEETPLMRPLRESESAVRPGTATDLATAENWLAYSEMPHACCKGLPAATAPFGARERLSPALMPLSVMNALFLDTANFNARARTERRKLFDYIETRCSDETYRRVQEEYCNFRALHCMSHLYRTDAGGFDFSPLEKYLHLPYWANSKLGIAKTLGLHQSPPLDILDLGSGPGHFGLVCEYYGHRYEGLDMDVGPLTPFSQGDIYADLFAGFGLPRLTQKIEAYAPLRTSKRYDLITCLMTCFSRPLVEGTRQDTWGWAEWRFFLHDLVNSVLKPDYRIFVQLMRVAAPDELMSAFECHGATVDRQRCIITFDSSQRELLFQD